MLHLILERTHLLVFSTGRDIRTIKTDGTNESILLGGEKKIVGIDIDYEQNHIYWTDLFNHGLYRANISNPMTSKEMIVKDLMISDGLAVDWIGRKIYWTDSSLKMIGVAELDGRHKSTLIKLLVDARPRAIVCDPFEGYVKVPLLPRRSFSLSPWKVD